MIGETLVDLFFGVLRMIFAGFELFSLPTQIISSLETILSYGVWVVGADIMVLFAGSVVFWWGIHLSIGFAVWVWEKLPLT